MYDRIHIESLKRGSSRAVRRESGIRSERASGGFQDVDISGADSKNARKVEPKLLARDEKVVRNWSRIGEKWMRRSGMFARGVEARS
jgi:hypothetical protein